MKHQKETEPDLSNIAGADRFGQDASAVLGLWRKGKRYCNVEGVEI